MVATKSQLRQKGCSLFYSRASGEEVRRDGREAEAGRSPKLCQPEGDRVVSVDREEERRRAGGLAVAAGPGLDSWLALCVDPGPEL